MKSRKIEDILPRQYLVVHVNLAQSMCGLCACNTEIYIDIYFSFIGHCYVQVKEDDQQYWDNVRSSLEEYREAVRVRKASVLVFFRQTQN